MTPAAVAVAWTLSFPAVTGAIVGARSPEQVGGWLPAATLELKEDDLAEIAAAVQATGAGTGPASPLLAAPPLRRPDRTPVSRISITRRSSAADAAGPVPEGASPGSRAVPCRSWRAVFRSLWAGDGI